MDSVVVGRYAGETALAAVGVVTLTEEVIVCIQEQSISHAMMNFISQCDGAGKDEKKKRDSKKYRKT